MFGFNKKRILIIGMPDLVLYCISALKKSKKNIVGVITSSSDDVTYDYMINFLKENKLLHIQHNKNFKDENLLKTIKDLKPDIAFVCSFNHLLPEELYTIPKSGTLNFHPSLLPEYRGANPYFHVINNNEAETGVTMHFMDKNFDTGDIVKQIKIKIEPDETMGSLFNKLNEATAQLCVLTANFLEKNKTLPRIPQNKTNEYKKASKIHSDTQDTQIQWDKTVDEIERFIRALNPFFGAFSIVNDCKIKFWNVEKIYNKAATSLPFGTITDITNEAIYISAKDGFIKTNIIGMNDKNYYSNTFEITETAKLQKGQKFE